MGAKVVYQTVKPLLEFRAVGFGEIFHCFSKLFVQSGSAGHSVAVPGEPDGRETQISMKQGYTSSCFYSHN